MNKAGRSTVRVVDPASETFLQVVGNRDRTNAPQERCCRLARRQQQLVIADTGHKPAAMGVFAAGERAVIVDSLHGVEQGITVIFGV
jgi:histidinol phosphatase-like PHP family hydrolase